jgi:aspartate-semialdehyde dehydrogenase
MVLGSESVRVVLAGAASLRGKDLKRWIEESGFPAGEVRLIDEEVAAGTLTEIGGEPTVIQTVDDSSFERMRFVFFTGSGSLAKKHVAGAERAGGTVIDLSGGLADVAGGGQWIPQLDPLLSPPIVRGRTEGRVSVCISPSAPAIIGSSVAAALSKFSPSRIAIVFFHPASERGQEGVQELEAQTTRLLTLQAMPQEVFDTQVAFNLSDRWGEESRVRLQDVREAAGQEVRTYLDGRTTVPSMMFVQAPVFFGYTFAVFADFSTSPDVDAVVEHLRAAGFCIADDQAPRPSNISVAGEAQAVVGRPERDLNGSSAYWLWGAADNLRICSANAVRIAERLLAS